MTDERDRRPVSGYSFTDQEDFERRADEALEVDHPPARWDTPAVAPDRDEYRERRRRESEAGQ